MAYGRSKFEAAKRLEADDLYAIAKLRAAGYSFLISEKGWEVLFYGTVVGKEDTAAAASAAKSQAHEISIRQANIRAARRAAEKYRSDWIEKKKAKEKGQ